MIMDMKKLLGPVITAISLLVILTVLTYCSQEVELPAGKIVNPYDSTDFKPAPAEVIYGSNNYTEYIVGDNESRIILSAPHGGYEEPESIRTRTSGVTEADRFTQELTRTIADSITARTGVRPHVIINKLHRKKLDPNRPIGEAAQGDAAAQQAWRDYQFFLSYARAKVVEVAGEGLYLDMHGHGHAIQRIEVGYLLGNVDLAKSDEQLNALAASTSIRALATRSALPFSQLVRGASSFGTLLHNAGYASVPSTQDPHPGIGVDYFEGGYCTQTYGSLKQDGVSAIQLECYRTGLREPEQSRRAFAGKLTDVIIEYFNAHYQVDLKKN
jgi:hypothetical protein